MIDYTENLAELKSTMNSLEDNLKLVKIDISDLMMAECLKVHKVKPGSIIREGHGGGGEFKVVRVFPDANQNNQPTLKGFKKKKDGDWGTQERHIWNYSSPWVLVSE